MSAKPCTQRVYQHPPAIGSRSAIQSMRQAPFMSNDLAACRREVAEVQHVANDTAAAGSRRELDDAHETVYATSSAAEGGGRREWPELSVFSAEDWDHMTVLIITEESMPPSKRLAPIL